MTKSKNKERATLSFSYLDAFFLLLAGYVLSLGIYLFTENAAKTAAPAEWKAEASAFYRDELLYAVPKAGDALFDEEGKRAGQILDVQTYQVNGRTEVLLSFLFQGEVPGVGEAFAVETADSVIRAEIVSVEETERGARP